MDGWMDGWNDGWMGAKAKDETRRRARTRKNRRRDDLGLTQMNETQMNEAKVIATGPGRRTTSGALVPLGARARRRAR